MFKYIPSYRFAAKILGLFGILFLASCSSTQGFYDADGIYTNQPMKVDTYPIDYAAYFDEAKQQADSYDYILDSEDYFAQSVTNSYGGWGEQSNQTNIYMNNDWNWGFGFYHGWSNPYYGWGWGWNSWHSPYYWHYPYYWSYPYYWGYPHYAYRNTSRSAYHRTPGRTVYSPSARTMQQTRTLNTSRDLRTSRSVLNQANTRSSTTINNRTQTVRRPVSRPAVNRSNDTSRQNNSSTIQRNTNRNISPSRSMNTGSSRSMGSGISRGSSRSR